MKRKIKGRESETRIRGIGGIGGMERMKGEN